MTFLSLFLTFVILQRIFELYIAKKNAVYIESLGGFEVGQKHYPFIVMLHITFLLSVYIESSDLTFLPTWWPIPFTIFILAQGMRFWTMASLGRFWNTRIYILPNSKPIHKGPYQFIRHPNYLIVMVEIITIPLIFGAYYSAILFPILNTLLLTIRIKVEEKALSTCTSYKEEMETIPRFFPQKNNQ
ncbi:isoprenylcysteine carboxyl methyltransferase family protein [Tepidibacillus sp. HK-1]|uniref:isoprenylcysteine carboxyl methyltransferase family protein n=1 Tax=Tepidibacillus sp. HK-1 TaxID=1883407 RepID=UPI000853C7F0|nr:isoprenylcysteine carboxylmethyltransferase family protein [Tepidibacillus sp. HK-1]GBF10340.1 isoprenylcysteine carboxyl methyltransferase ICMT family protein [Tepidibacillus sp. HK-1]